MATGDTASDPFSRPWPNEGEEGSLTFNKDTTIVTRPRQAGKRASSKNTAGHPAVTLR